MPPIRGPDDFARAFPVSRETLGRLETYAALLKQWQKTINLVAPSTLDAIWSRHFADSAQLLLLAPHDARTWLDLGTGAGFPGLVLAILRAEQNSDGAVGWVMPQAVAQHANREDVGARADAPPQPTQLPRRHILIESDSRKAAFLREAARQTGVAVDILCARIESPATHAKVGRIDVVTARALAPLGSLLELASPYFARHSKGLFLKGREVEAEVAAARKGFEFDLDLYPSLSDPEGRVTVISNLRVKSEG